MRAYLQLIAPLLQRRLLVIEQALELLHLRIALEGRSVRSRLRARGRRRARPIHLPPRGGSDNSHHTCTPPMHTTHSHLRVSLGEGSPVGLGL